jgi:magnesium chelatase subunit D
VTRTADGAPGVVRAARGGIDGAAGQAAVDDAVRVAMLLAVDPVGLGGVVLDHAAHEAARAWVTVLRRLLPEGAPVRRVPSGVTADRLIGGVDLAATLAAGRLVAEQGVLAAADGGVVVVPMAERADTSVRTVLAEALDRHEVHVARDGVVARHPARIAAVLLDESTDDEAIHPALRDRVAFHVRDLMAMPPVDGPRLVRQVHDARARLAAVAVDDRWLEAVCTTAVLFGADSARSSLLALRCARAHAALAGRDAVEEADAEVAARLVIAPRATRVPPMPPDESEPPPEPPEPTPPEPPRDEQPPEPPPETDADDEAQRLPDSDTDLLRDAVMAALPPGLLAELMARAATGGAQGRVGDEQAGFLRGRPRGARAGLPRGGARLHLLETLRAAAPWQRVRARPAGRPASIPSATLATTPVRPAATAAPPPRVAIRREDFRIRRYVEKTGTTAIFVVDASGSSALQRLSEAKGAIELLLAESYARRDRVSLLAFRGLGTEVLLPPTRALARAKRVLAALPGGGGTPMANAIDTALAQALAARRAGTAPLVVILSDGRANIGRDGTPGRAGAERDALESAAAFARAGVPSMFIDTSPRGEATARRLAAAMQSRYVFLPAADAKALGAVVRTAMSLASDAGGAGGAR